MNLIQILTGIFFLPEKDVYSKISNWSLFETVFLKMLNMKTNYSKKVLFVFKTFSDKKIRDNERQRNYEHRRKIFKKFR